MTGQPAQVGAVVVHQVDLFVAGAVGGEGDAGQGDAGAAGEAADDLVGEGMGHAPGHGGFGSIALGQDRRAAGQVEQPALEHQLAVVGGHVGPEQVLVAQGAVLLEVSVPFARELQDLEGPGALDLEVAGDLKVVAQRFLHFSSAPPGHASHRGLPLWETPGE